MRRAMTGLAATLLLFAAGCARSEAPRPVLSTPVVMGTSAAIGGSAGASGTASSTPAIDAIPAIMRTSAQGRAITLATGQPQVPRERVLARYGTPTPGATLVSAVFVLLPKSFMSMVLSDPKKAKPTLAWIVTYSGVTQRPHGGAAVVGATQIIAPARLGMTTYVIDAATLEMLEMSEYPTPK